MDIIVAEHLTKRFGDLAAVADVSFSVREGETFGFLGPNGAGKTTTTRMIQCVSPPTSGRLEVAGMDVRERERDIKAVLGVAPQEDNLDPDLSVRENLLLYATYFDVPPAEAAARADELLEFFQLTAKAGTDIEKLSGGMKRRLLLARALINRPRVLVLDEPTTGLDPQARHLIWDRLRELRSQGSTILLTTHYMDEAERLCDRLVVMDGGRIIEEGSPRELVERSVGAHVVEVEDRPGVRECVEGLASAGGVEAHGGVLHVSTGEPQEIITAILSKCGDVNASVRRASLEDVFLRLTGRRLRD